MWWIRQSILQAIAEQSRIVRLPLNQVGSVNKINRELNKFEQENERRPSVDEIADRVDILVTKGLSKPGRVREIFKGTTGRLTKKEIMDQCPDISQKTVERALTELMASGEIIKIGGGRYTSYIWNREKD